MNNHYLNNCLCCLSENKSLLNLGNIPLANDFNAFKQSETYPLELMVCPNCYHCQLHFIVNPEILFKNYKYVSGTSQTGLDFFKQNAKFINENYLKGTNSSISKGTNSSISKGTNSSISKGNVLDIACNDGSQLDYFKELGWNTYGVDPAINLQPISSKKGHTIICDFWNETIAKQLPKMDVIIAQNVFAHTEHIDAFLQACKIIMSDNSTLFIQTSQKNMIINSEFDTIYHEHISFFNTKSMDILVSRNGLVLNRILEATIHGTSYIFEIKLNKNEFYNIHEHIIKETEIGLYSDSLYNTFKLNANKIVNSLKTEIEKYNSLGYKCIGFGAAAKAQTILCYGNINLEYIIDENPLKIGLYSPKMNIPIVDIDYFKNDNTEKILIIILAWNFADEIINKIKFKNVVKLSYFPEIKYF